MKFRPFGLEDIPDDWVVSTVSDVSKLVTRGKQPKYQESGTMVLNQKMIQNDGIHYEFAKRHDVTKSVKPELFINQYDIVLNSTGTGTAGRSQIFLDVSVEDLFMDSHVTLIRPDLEKVNPIFMFAQLHDARFVKYIEDALLAGSTGQVELSKSKVLDMPILLPPLSVQDKFGALYESLMRKQSLLGLINDNLLELGRSYYQNFVDTHDTEGQMVSTIAESVITGKTPSTKDESNYGDDVPFVTIPDMHSQIFTTKTTRSLSKKGADSQVKKYLPPFTLSVSSIGTPGLVTINPEESQTNQQINSVIAEKEKIWYLFLAFDSLKAHIENMGSGGSTILNLNKSNFEKIDIDWPIDKSALIEFNTVIEPIFMNILNNQREIDSLSMVRDTLLSELI